MYLYPPKKDYLRLAFPIIYKYICLLLMLSMPKRKSKVLDSRLLSEVKEGNHRSYSILFYTYYKNLVLFAGTIVQDKSVCEDIVQNIFLKLWRDRETLTIETSLKSYLLQAVRNSCIDSIRHKQIVDNYVETFYTQDGIFSAEDYVLHSDLNRHLKNALSKLPDKQREAFVMSRYKEMKYKDIAKKLNVAERTVEDRISKALAKLRVELKDFLLILILIFICI